jgi:hypothetical protein
MMRMPTPFWSLVGPSLVLALCCSCAPDVTRNTPTPGARAMFDPGTGNIPLPNDLLLNPTTGHLALPIDPAVDSSLTQEIKANLDQLDGWLTAQTITLPFDAPLDPATVTPGSVILVDAGPARAAPVVTPVPADKYYAAFNVGRTPATGAPYSLMLKNKPAAPVQPPADFAQGHRYAAIVTDAVLGTDQLPIIGHPALEFLKSTTPLVDGNGRSVTILSDAQAAQLELARSTVYAPVFDALAAADIVQREHAMAFAVFSVQSGARPIFNPTAIGNALPTPIDVSGPANAPLDASAEVLLDEAYEPSTAAVAAHLFKVGAGFEPVAITVQPTSVPDPNGHYPLQLVPDSPLEPTTSYVALLTDALLTTGGVPAQAGSYFSLVRATSPLLDETTNPPTLGSPFVDLTLDVLILMGKDPVTASPGDWSDAFNLLVLNLHGLEQLRLGYAPLLDATTAAGIDRQQVIVLWSFTTAAQ